jgi:hypothetical protein
VKIRYAVAAGALALATAPLAAPASASCGPVVEVACAVLCRVPNPTVYRLCTIL